MNQMMPVADLNAEDAPLPATVEACDAEIEDIQDEVDDIAAQIEAHDAGLGTRDEAWRRRAYGAWIARKKELALLRRHRQSLAAPAAAAPDAKVAEREAKKAERQARHEALLARQQAEKAARAAKQDQQADAAERRRQAEHERKMERIRAANDRNLSDYQRLRGWLHHEHPSVWEDAKAFLGSFGSPDPGPAVSANSGEGRAATPEIGDNA